MRFPAELKYQRTEFKMTQKQLADKLRVSESTVRMWELGKNIADIKNVIRLSKVLDNDLIISVWFDDMYKLYSDF